MGYLPLRISTVPPDRQLTFDLYINFKEQYLKLADSGSAIDHEKLEKLKN